MGKLLPVLLALIGLGLGVGAGFALKPAPELATPNPCGDIVPAESVSAHGTSEDMQGAETASDFVKLNNQFVIPVVDDGKVAALVVLSLSLEIAPGGNEVIYQREPKLRDAFLQILFDHANAGGFAGVFTDGSKLNALRMALRESAVKILGQTVKDILVTDLVRQDI